MTTPIVEQVIVGKMSFPQASGQISLFAPPPHFAWLGYFSATEIAEFLAELLDALSQSQESGDWSCVSEVIEAWKATANVKADLAVQDRVERGLAELAEGQGVNWAELRVEMGL